MKLSKFQAHQSDAVVSLFENTFGDSEGEKEGKSIGKLVRKLIETTDANDITGFIAEGSNILQGSIFFSRLSLPTNVAAFMLSPVAVSTDYQRMGVGQSLIKFGLEQIKLDGVELVVTYGDPNYYVKVGFEVISENIIASPYPLTYPEAWQAQSLVSEHLSPIQGGTQCVEAFRQQAYW